MRSYLGVGSELQVFEHNLTEALLDHIWQIGLHCLHEAALALIKSLSERFAEFVLPENVLQIGVVEQAADHRMCHLHLLRSFLQFFAHFIP